MTKKPVAKEEKPEPVWVYRVTYLKRRSNEDGAGYELEDEIWLTKFQADERAELLKTYDTGHVYVEEVGWSPSGYAT